MTDDHAMKCIWVKMCNFAHGVDIIGDQSSHVTSWLKIATSTTPTLFFQFWFAFVLFYFLFYSSYDGQLRLYFWGEKLCDSMNY
jgi:hypothetical protein